MTYGRGKISIKKGARKPKKEIRGGKSKREREREKVTAIERE